MPVFPSESPAKRRTFTPYLLVWLALGGFSLAYLTFIGVRPDLVAAWQSGKTDTQNTIAETQRNVERALADLDPLKESVGEVKMEVANVKIGLDESMQRDRILLEKVEALERHAVEAQEKIAAVTPKKADPKPSAAKPKAANIETGSIEQEKAAAPAKPAPVGVLLATGPSVDSLRLSWTILNDRHADAVRSLNPRYVVNGKADERTYGLVAGPLKTVADAKAVCKTMMERGMSCEVSVYRGSTF